MNWYLMVWNKYAEFSGRSRRTEYWMFVLFNVLAVFVLAIIGGAGIAMTQGSNSAILFFIPLCLYSLAAIIPSLAVATRRFHDIGKSGGLLALLILLGIIPIVGFVTAIIQIVFLCTDSQPGPNQYGPNPKFPDQAVAVIPGSPGYPPMAYPAQPQPPVAYPVQSQPSAAYPPQPQAYSGASGYGVCRTCGAQLEGPSAFCGKCGAQV